VGLGLAVCVDPAIAGPPVPVMAFPGHPLLHRHPGIPLIIHAAGVPAPTQTTFTQMLPD
jgi:hypothetical protein